MWLCSEPIRGTQPRFKIFSPLIYSETYWACLHLAVYCVSPHPVARVWIKETWVKKKKNNCSIGWVTVFQADISITCMHLFWQTWLQRLLCMFCFVWNTEHSQCSTQSCQSVLPFSNCNCKSLSHSDWKTLYSQNIFCKVVTLSRLNQR